MPGLDTVRDGGAARGAPAGGGFDRRPGRCGAHATDVGPDIEDTTRRCGAVAMGHSTTEQANAIPGLVPSPQSLVVQYF